MSLKFEIIETKRKKEIAKILVEKNHSYVPTFDSVGRRIDWLIYEENEIIGMIGIGSSVYPPPKDLLEWLGMSKSEYAKNFNSFANNWRFCLKKREKNLGTRVLRYLRENAPHQWKLKYGDDLKWLITFVGGGNNGAVYRADNWNEIGHTSGLPPHKAISMKWNDSNELKSGFVKPNGEDKKIIFAIKLKDKIVKNEIELFDL